MSKAYSFRLDEHNYREAQAKGIIHAWVEEGKSLTAMMIAPWEDSNLQSNDCP